jgi:hypothetical protein
LLSQAKQLESRSPYDGSFRMTQLAPQEVARIGDDIYSRSLQAQLEGTVSGQIVAIDVVSGDYEVAETALRAGRNLRLRRPDAQVWLVRVGDVALHRIGAGRA